MAASIKLRLVEEKDVPEILEIYRPYVEDTAVSFETELPSEQEFWQRIEEVLSEAPWLVCEINGEIAGYGYASAHRGRAAYQWNRELSAYVSPEYQRRGIGRGLYTSVLSIIKQQGYYNALAGITLPNPDSVGFHGSMGFKKIGTYHGIGFKFGKITDTGWWEMKVQEEGFTPGEIILLPEILRTAEWEQAMMAGVGKIRV